MTRFTVPLLITLLAGAPGLTLDAHAEALKDDTSRPVRPGEPGTGVTFRAGPGVGTMASAAA